MIKVLRKILVLFTAFFLFLSLSNFVFAETKTLAEVENDLQPVFDDIIPLLSEAPLSNCLNTLVPLYDAETLIFFKFLESNFQNKSANNSLVNIAIARFSEYKRNLNGYLIQLSPQGASDEGISYSDELGSISICRDLTDSYIHYTRIKMISYIKTTSSQKKTTIMVEKYQSINDKLRSLNFNMAQMYSYFATFKNKLPGYLSKQCITR